MRLGKAWTPREIRRLIALVFLAGGGIAMTLFAAFKLTPLVAKSGETWALSYALLSALAIIALVMFFFGWSIVKAMVTLQAGAASFSASGGSGDGEEQAPPPVVTTTTTTTVPTGAPVTPPATHVDVELPPEVADDIADEVGPRPIVDTLTEESSK